MRYYLYSVLSTLYRVRRVCTHVLTVKQYGLAARLLLLWFRLWLECLDVCHGADIMQLIRNSMYHWCAYDAGNFKPPPINRVSFWRQSIVCLSDANQSCVFLACVLIVYSCCDGLCGLSALIPWRPLCLFDSTTTWYYRHFAVVSRLPCRCGRSWRHIQESCLLLIRIPFKLKCVCRLIYRRRLEW